jgi:ubiquinone/menaquinone biosynthesis C-methylase UbiE
MKSELDRGAVASLRALLDAARLPMEPDDRAGYLDVIGATDEQPRTLAGRLMRSGTVATIYQRGWRQAINVGMGIGGLSAEAERQYAVRSLRLGGEQRVLDVACGPGNFTHVFASALTGDGVAVGLDASPPMLAQAVSDNAVARAAYLRADARRMPFADGTFDAVCCYAALYLIPEPFSVLAEMLRVLAPGGRIALMTSFRGRWEPQRTVRGLFGLASGMRMFDRDELPAVLRAAGMVEIDQEIKNVVQFVNATKPA